MERVVIRDQAEWDKWVGVLILTEQSLIFERSGVPPDNFIECFNLPVSEIDPRVDRLPKKTLVCNFKGQAYRIKVKNPNEWVKMLTVLRGG